MMSNEDSYYSEQGAHFSYDQSPLEVGPFLAFV